MAIAPSQLAIAANGLRKSYGDKVVLDGIDLAVPEGTIFSLLGPNGAGKTTTVKILSTLISRRRRRRHPRRRPRPRHRPPRGPRRDRCHRPVLRRRQPDHRRGEHAPHGATCTTWPAARAGAAPPSCWSASTWSTRPRSRPSTYSGGMKRRLDLAMTLVGDPRIIFLDEPTTGLDPRSRHTMWQIIRELVADGVTVFLTTQYLDEADELADRIAVLDHGKIVAEGTADELKRLHPRRTRPAAVRRPGRRTRRGRPRPGRRPPATTRRSPCRSPATAASSAARLLDRLDGRRSRSTS